MFVTTRRTLSAYSPNFFTALLSASNPPRVGTALFIDRSPLLFPYVLDFLRYGRIPLSIRKSKTLSVYMLAADLLFYNVSRSPAAAAHDKALQTNLADAVRAAGPLLQRSSMKVVLHDGDACPGGGVCVVRSGASWDALPSLAIPRSWHLTGALLRVALIEAYGPLLCIWATNADGVFSAHDLPGTWTIAFRPCILEIPHAPTRVVTRSAGYDGKMVHLVNEF